MTVGIIGTVVNIVGEIIMTDKNKIAKELEALAYPVNKLKHLDGNPRKGNVEAVAKSYDMFGQRKPIVATKDGTVISGNHQLEAVKQLGWDKIAVLFTDDDELKAKAFALADNRVSDLGTYDKDFLAEMISSVSSNLEMLEATSFTETDLEKLIDPEVKEDYTGVSPDQITESKVNPGDIWKLDNHIIYCGDATDDDNYRSNNAITFTSPPYNVGRSVGSKFGKYQNIEDNDDQYLELLTDSMLNALDHSQYVFYNLQHLANNKIELIEFLFEFRGEYVDTIIWDKKTTAPAVANNVMNSRFEYIFIFSNKTNKRSITTGKKFRGTIDNVYAEFGNYGNSEYSKIHKAMFPLHLPEFIYKNFSSVKDRVMDNFMGIGTSLIVAEQLNRKFVGIELDPVYCDLAIDRWEKLTNKKAILIESRS